MAPLASPAPPAPDAEQYGTFPVTPSSPLASGPPKDEPGRPPRGDALYRQWPLLAVGLLVMLGLLTQTMWRSPPPQITPPAPRTPPPTFTYIEAAVYVSNSLRWQQLSYGKCDESKASACAMYNDSIAVSGWNVLWIRALPRDGSYAAYCTSMFAAGYAEGALTHQRIWETFQNTDSSVFGSDAGGPARVQKFLRRNLAWVRSRVAAHTPPNAPPDGTEEEAAYWQTIGGIMAQFDGLVAGYREFSPPDRRLSEIDLFMFNADGDLIDLVPALNGTTRSRFARLHAPRTSLSYSEAVKSLRCSALVRVLPDQSEVLVGHATWDFYTAMNRMYKHYDVPVAPAGQSISGAPRRQVSFSSSPGWLGSVDDWYLVDSGLVVLETTNGIYRDALYTLLTPNSVLSWARSYAANVLAADGPRWTELFSKYNSGTYNNQWMVLDRNRFVRDEGFQSHGFMVLEQIPGRIQVGDMSRTLNEQGYWASFNIPFFDVIYEMSGFRDEYVRSGRDASWSHDDTSRALIFAREAPKVRSLADLKRLMRSNDWRSDPYCQGHPSRGIAARYDLEPEADLRAYEGAIDAKVTSLHMAARLECEAVNGPTTQGNPAFDWRAVPKTCPLLHLGQPNRFDFTYQLMKPRAYPRRGNNGEHK